jgi:butyryl-CoA dehydrogenase
MSLVLTEEQDLIGQSAREFAKEYLEPLAVELDHTGFYPADTVKKLAAHDFLGLLLAGEYGGADAGFVSLVTVLENLSRVSASVASIVLNHSLAAFAIQQWGLPKLKMTLLPALASGLALGAFAIHEHGPALGMAPDALRATRKGEDWLLKGTKAYVRNAGAADVYVVLACTDPAAGPKGMTAFVVRGSTPGLKVGEPLDTMGLKGCPVADLMFEDVVLPENAMLGALTDGPIILTETLAIASLGEAAQTLGIGQAAVEHAAAYSKTRIQFGRPISSLQAIQTLLAETLTDCHMGRLATLHAADLIDQGSPFQVEAAMVKQFLARFGSKMLVDTVQVEGGFGYSEFMPLPRLFRDIAGTTLLEPPANFPDKTIAGSLLA